MSHPAELTRREKERYPERFCSAKGCLWRIGDRFGKYLGPCKSVKHVHLTDASDRARLESSTPVEV
jgi:hypothetical protein